MSPEVATIDRRDVFRIQRAQITGIVPIVEMTTKALHSVHRRSGRLDPLQHFESSQPAEISRSDYGQKIQANICWRCSVSDDRLGCFLKIIGRKHVVFRRYEFLEEQPGATCNQSQCP